jgi:YVTN family beta-propeller protein
LVALLFPSLAGAQLPISAYANFEGSQTTPVRLSPDGTRLFAVNTAAARLSVFDTSQPSRPVLIAEIPVGLEPVSVCQRTGDEVWVVNQVSDSISVVSVSRRIVTDTIYVKDEPADVVFAGTNLAFVSVSRSNEVRVFNATTHELVSTIPVLGGSPRQLAVGPSGGTVYAVFALSGNQTTILRPSLAPPPPPPTNPALPPAPDVGMIISALDPRFAAFIPYRMPDNDVAVIDTSTLTVTNYFSNVGALNLGIAVRPTTGDLFVANTQARNLIRFEPNVRGHWVDNRITRILLSGQVTPFDLNPNIDYATLPNPAALVTALSQPAAIAFDPGGEFMYVAAFGTDRVAKVDINGNVLSTIEIGPSPGTQVNPRTILGPRGLALHASAKRLYVLNRISNTISVVSTANGQVLRHLPVGAFDPTPLAIRNGRGFLYDAKLSGNGTGSCASCHLDGDMDHLAWDLGDPGGDVQTVTSGGKTFDLHPMKGPMVTQTLKGLINLAPYHWRGDRADFAAFNPAFDKLMGGTPLSAADMDAYTSFVNTMRFHPNPFQNLDRTFPTSLDGGNASNGRAIFLNATTNPVGTCNNCHKSDPGPGTNRQLVLLGNETQALKVPHLRNVYQKLLFHTQQDADSIDGFGLTNDGQAPTVKGFLAAVFPVLRNDPPSLADVAAFLLSFDTGTAPAVGYTRTVTAANLPTQDVQRDLTLLQEQVVAGNVDLIAKGTLNGAVHGLLYQPAQGAFRTDRTGLGPFSRQQLSAMIAAGDVLTFMGVPPGSGVWMGIDQNLDGVLDGDLP